MVNDKVYTKVYTKKKRNIEFHVSEAEYMIYHSLPEEKKALLKAIVKTLLYNPDLLDNTLFWQKFVVMKSFSQYICPVCFTPFNTYPALMKHLRYATHPPRCGVCGEKFDSIDALYDHFRKKHIGL